MAQLQVPISDELMANMKAKAALSKLTLRQFVIKAMTSASKLANSGGK
jgi:hypothetical protein